MPGRERLLHIHETVKDIIRTTNNPSVNSIPFTHERNANAQTCEHLCQVHPANFTLTQLDERILTGPVSFVWCKTVPEERERNLGEYWSSRQELCWRWIEGMGWARGWGKRNAALLYRFVRQAPGMGTGFQIDRNR